jgi:hypothetical protein
MLSEKQIRAVLAGTNDMVRNSMYGPFWPELEEACRAIEAAANAELRAELERVQAENFALAAGQCIHATDGLTADEGGTPYCQMQKKLAKVQAERDLLLNDMHQMHDIISRSQNSLNSMHQCGRIVRAAIARTEGEAP